MAKLLCTADVHLGRRPTRVPEGLDAHRLGPAAAWERLIDVAIEQAVDAVLLAGDVVDADNRFYEAFAPLAEGVERLLAAGIPIHAVAGNHDHDVLARLADQFAGFHLLGRGGAWEVAELGATAGQPPASSGVQHPTSDVQPPTSSVQHPTSNIQLIGWSFPDRYVARNPLDDFPVVDPSRPVVGLLHADVDAAGSRYAPVRLAELTSKPVAAWLLGHVHQPALLSDAPPVLYPGSLQGLDPGEPGRRGGWLLSIGDGPARFEPIPLAGLRYGPIDVDLSEHDADEPLDARVAAAVRDRVHALRDELGPAEAIGFRVRLTGRVDVALRRRLPAAIAKVSTELPLPIDGVQCFVESVADRTEPRLPLEELARSSDPLGLLARRVLVLERREPPEQYDRLIREAGPAVAHARAAAPFASLEDGDHSDHGNTEPTDEHVRGQLLDAGRALLAELHAQREEPR